MTVVKFKLETVLRYGLLVSGLFILSLGVAISAKAGLGTSPISCVPYVLSLAMPWTLGQITIAVNLVFILIQVLLLRRKFPLIQLLQLPVVFLFGFFCDLGMSIVHNLTLPNYFSQISLSLLSTLIVALGVFLEVKANVVMLPGEGVVKAVSIVTAKEFGKLKISFDCTLLAAGICLSLICFNQLQGVREGTIISAVLVGFLVSLYNRQYKIIRKSMAY